MKKCVLCLTVVIGIILGSFSSGFTEDLFSLPDKLYIEKILALRVVNSPQPALRIVIVFKNDSENAVKMRGGIFNVIINPESLGFDADEFIMALGGEEELIPNKRLLLGKVSIGTGSKAESKFAAETDSLYLPPLGSITTIIEIPMTPNEPAQSALILQLINYLGTPTAKKQIAMLGKAKIGIQGTRGWAYQEMELELYYKAKVEREILLE